MLNCFKGLKKTLKNVSQQLEIISLQLIIIIRLKLWQVEVCLKWCILVHNAKCLFRRHTFAYGTSWQIQALVCLSKDNGFQKTNVLTCTLTCTFQLKKTNPICLTSWKKYNKSEVYTVVLIQTIPAILPCKFINWYEQFIRGMLQLWHLYASHTNVVSMCILKMQLMQSINIWNCTRKLQRQQLQ